MVFVTISPQNHEVIMSELSRREYFQPTDASRAEQSRISAYLDYMNERGKSWLEPDLEKWRDYLLKEKGLSPVTVRAYLSTIRSRYRRIFLDNTFHAYIQQKVNEQLPDAREADIKAVKDEMLLRISNAVHPENSPVKVTQIQDVDERKYIRLTPEQVNELLALPDRNTLTGLRDAAMLALAICTGVRADELTNVRIEDIDGRYGGKPALVIQQGKGDKQRLVPYGDLIWCLNYVENWLNASSITEGYIFRNITKDNTIGTQLNRESLEKVILPKYRLFVDGIKRQINPHDLRRTYAKLQYDLGMPPIAIQQNLGHKKLETTLGYIGDVNANERQGRAWD